MKKLICMVLALACFVGTLSCQYACAEEIIVSAINDAPVVRKPVALTKTGTAACPVNNDMIQGTFYVNYTVKYTVSGGIYTVGSCTVTYDYFTGWIRGDLYQPSATYSSDLSGNLTITVSYQVKYQENGITYYSPRGYASTTVSLIN